MTMTYQQIQSTNLYKRASLSETVFSTTTWCWNQAIQMWFDLRRYLQLWRHPGTAHQLCKYLSCYFLCLLSESIYIFLIPLPQNLIDKFLSLLFGQIQLRSWAIIFYNFQIIQCFHWSNLVAHLPQYEWTNCSSLCSPPIPIY